MMYPLMTGTLKIETLTVCIPGLPPSLCGTKIVQLTDFHDDGWRLSEKLLQKAMTATNETEPDLIVLTGDYITREPAPIHHLTPFLRQLRSRRGIYGILGNHDYKWPGAKVEVITALRGAGVQVLYNQVVYPFGAGLALVGLADLWSGDFHPAGTFAALSPATPRIVLSHNPETAALLQPWRIDLQLSGHTHGGQIVLPKIGPLPQWIEPVRKVIPPPIRRWLPYLAQDSHKMIKHWEWSQGFHQVGANYLYVSRGLGTYFPGRLFCPPEVTVITLESLQREE